jgi:transaldolase
MKLFIDTGSVAEVEEIAAWGVLSGATTNPTLLAKEEGDPGDAIKRICELVDGPTSAEVVSDNVREMVAEGRALAALDDRVVVKVPFSAEGLAATRELASDGIPVNETLVFSAAQALLTVEAGATYVSCFMGRLDDISVTSEDVVREIVEALGPNRDAQVLAASIRHPVHAVTAARLRGLDAAREGAEADAWPSAHRVRHREVRRRLEEPARVRRMAARAGRPERGGEELDSGCAR